MSYYFYCSLTQFTLHSLFLFGGLFFPFNLFAQNPIVNISLYCFFGDHSIVSGNMPRTPDPMLSIGLEDHTLYMSNVDFDCELQILDENDDVVYTTFVAANTSTIVLPSTLLGEYQILLIDEERYFYGWLNL